MHKSTLRHKTKLGQPRRELPSISCDGPGSAACRFFTSRDAVDSAILESMPQLITAIDIDAPIERVWKILSDTASWGRWNPLLKSFKGQLEEGAKAKVSLLFEGKTLPISVELLDVKPLERISWIGPAFKPARNIFSGTHYFELKEIEGGKTRLIHGERFRGLIPDGEWFWKAAEPRVEPAYKAFNEALKAEAEASV